jgi:hypothetical protein
VLVYLEGGPFDAETRDLDGVAYQADLFDDEGRNAIYVATPRVTESGVPIWIADQDG